ncbi:MAG: hypothetical protein PWP27_1654 [Clostridiales bacterium]|nr:hypothetical protein [Clostridiales bacterium]MDK2933844.1 hypothetical protein [Clostridiales bacterium]
MDFARQITILEICNPQEAKSVLEKNIKAAYFLSCKIVVCEDGGKGIVGIVKPSNFIEMLNDNELKEIAQNIEQKLIGVLNNLK